MSSDRNHKNGRRALLVDDEPMVCESLKMLLEYDGYRVETAQSGHDAVRLFEPGKFDLVFTDFNMPGMNGHELASIIKSRKRDQPVIMVTAYADMALTEGILPDVDVVVAKPFGIDEIREAIERAKLKTQR